MFCAHYYAKQTKKNKKKQAKYVSFAMLIPLIGALFTDLIFVGLGIEFPEITLASGIFTNALVGYAIWKYQLFNISIEIATENIISIMPDSLILIDAEGKISAVNRSLIKLLGYEEDELHGKPADALVAEKRVVSKILEKMNVKGEVKNYETKFKTKSDEEIDVILSASIVRDKQEKISGVVAVVHDITKKKQMEELILRSEKLAVLGQASTMVGHDLRNPLTEELLKFQRKKKTVLLK